MEGYLSDEYMFVYLRMRSDPLRDLECLRELSLDLSKKNRSDRVSSLQRKGIAANLHRQRKGIAANLHRPFYQL